MTATSLCKEFKKLPLSCITTYTSLQESHCITIHLTVKSSGCQKKEWAVPELQCQNYHFLEGFQSLYTYGSSKS